jgi:hypothetical protein
MKSNRGPSMKADRHLLEMAKTMDLAAIVKKAGHRTRLALAARVRDLREVHPDRRGLVRLTAGRGWDEHFEMPIELPGTTLKTLRDAIRHLATG